jgi:hypothetical protein
MLLKSSDCTDDGDDNEFKEDTPIYSAESAEETGLLAQRSARS